MIISRLACECPTPGPECIRKLALGGPYIRRVYLVTTPCVWTNEKSAATHFARDHAESIIASHALPEHDAKIEES